MNKQKYYVLSEWESPTMIRFTWEEAIKEDCFYIDVFDEDGNPEKSWKLDENTSKYTDDF